MPVLLATNTLEWLQETNLINIAIAAFLIILLLGKLRLGSKIEESRENLAAEVAALEKSKQAAEDQLNQLKKQTANLNAEVDAILAAARESAESVSQTILNNAHAQAAKIVESTKSRIELEQRAAVKDLEARLLNDALGDARSELAQSMDSQSQRRSVEAFLDQLPKGGR